MAAPDPAQRNIGLFPPGGSQDHHNYRVRRVDIASGATTTLAGSGALGQRDGASATAQFWGLLSIAIDPSGAFALVTVRDRLRARLYL